MSHTPTPWRKAKNSFGTPIITTFDEELICFFSQPNERKDANAVRIVECVNLFDGIEHPQSYISNLAYERDKAEANIEVLLEALRVARKQLLKSGINVDNADVYNTIDKAIKSVAP